MKVSARLLMPLLLVGGLVGLTAPAAAQTSDLMFGGDHYAAGQQTSAGAPVDGDAFLAGYDVTLNAPVAQSAHLGGFNVNANADVGDNLYATGFTVNVNAPVAGNVTAAGSSVTLAQGATVGGNVRLAGASVSLLGPVAGSALVATDALTLSGTIAGDFSFYGRSITFAPGAKVDGAVVIHAPEQIAVPASVAPAGRVRFTVLEDTDYMSEAGRTAETVVRGVWPAIWGLVAFWAVLVLLGAAFMAFFPHRLARMQARSETQPFRSIGWGLLTFAMLLGLVPLTAITIVGILALPLVFLFIALCFGLAYVLGAYLVGTRIARNFVGIDSALKRLGVLAASLVVAVALGLIPFIGWLLTLLLVGFGLGVTTRTLINPRTGGGATPVATTQPHPGPGSAPA